VDFVEKRTGDLDALIHAHRVFLERLVRKVLLSAGKRDKEVCFTELYKPCGGY
jgi:gamma-tubulin complex component 3